ncbi:MAG TPA: hypothetical protein VF889_02500, partial [Bacteroidota bacterium]
FFILAWRRMKRQEVSKRVWGLLALGIVLWTLAEFIWAFYEQVLKMEVPYPSVADFLWLAGYIPMYVALLIRYRSFRSSASGVQKRIVLLFMLLYSAVVAIYIAGPLVESFDSARLAESLTNVAYPLADWGLCLLTLVIIFSLERGRFARVWHLFGTGILLSTTADLLFFYVSWKELYYPGGQVNLVSGVVDGIFNISYLLLGLAVYSYVILAESFPPVRLSLVLSSLAKMEILIFVNPQGRILSVSDNFMNLVHSPTTKPYVGMNLAQALGIPEAAAADLLNKILSPDPLSNYPIKIKDAAGEIRHGWLTSLLMLNEQGQLDSVALVLRADRPPDGETEILLKEDQRMLIDYYLKKSGTSRTDDNQALHAYFLAQVNLLHSLLRQYSGAQVADKLLEQLGRRARQGHLQFSYRGQDIRIPDDLDGEALRDLILPLLEEARNFTMDMTDRRMVEQEMKSLEMNLPPQTLRILDRYGLRLTTEGSFKLEAAPQAA